MTRQRDVRDRIAVNRWRRQAERERWFRARARSLVHHKPRKGPYKMEYRDRRGRQITAERWSRMIEDSSYRQVKLTFIGDVMISTIWLGTEHPINGWFETLVKHGGFPETLVRAPNEKLARIQHRRAAHCVHVWASVNKLEAKANRGKLSAASVDPLVQMAVTIVLASNRALLGGPVS